MWHVGEAVALWPVIIGGFVLLTLGAFRLVDKLAGRRFPAARKGHADITLKVAIMTSVVLVSFVPVIIYTHSLPMLVVITLFLALGILWSSLTAILSRNTIDVVTERLRMPLGLTRWVDLYASADPVPNGGTSIAGTTSAQAKPGENCPTPRSGFKSVRVWNRDSILSDHTTYWDNLDGFVLRIARVCAEAAESPWHDKLPPPTLMCWADERAKWRVGILRWAVRINRTLWGVAGALIWTRHLTRVPQPFEFPAWFPASAPTAARTAVLAVAMVVAVWATETLLAWPWSRWVRAEQEAVLAHEYPSDTFPIPLLGMGLVISLLLVLAWVLAWNSYPAVSELLVNPGEWLTPIIISIITFFILFASIAFLRNRPSPRDNRQTFCRGTPMFESSYTSAHLSYRSLRTKKRKESLDFWRLYPTVQTWRCPPCAAVSGSAAITCVNKNKPIMDSRATFFSPF